jgi:hypothetical protein
VNALMLRNSGRFLASSVMGEGLSSGLSAGENNFSFYFYFIVPS